MGAVLFGADAAVAARPSEQMRLPSVLPTTSDTGTDIAAGLRLARFMGPDTGARRILLISDGVATAGDAAAEARRAADLGIIVDVLPADFLDLRRPLAVRRVLAPPERRAHEPFNIGVELEGGAGDTGAITLYRDGAVFATEEATVGPSGVATIALTDAGEEPGVHVFRATTSGRDASAASSSVPGAVVVVSGATRVLYVSDQPDPLPDMLRAAGFRVDTVAAESVPRGAAALTAFDAIVLADVPPERFDDLQLSAVARFVEQDGGGLMVLGSARALARGGYPIGPLERVLPIDLRPRAGRRAPALNLFLVFDKSGSMSDLDRGVPRIELARQAVMQVLDVLAPTDALGVLAFDAQPTVVTSLEAPRDARALAARLQGVVPGGATSIAPALEAALRSLHDALGSSTARSKILLISDGRTTASDADRALAAVARAGIEVSTVAIGDDADRVLLGRLAESTGGKAFFPASIQDLPRIVSREAARSSGGAFVQEPFTPRATSHPVLAGLDRARMPQLAGYVVSAVKPTATTVLGSHLDDPVFGVWRVGLGRVGVMTTDLRTSWGSGLVRWDRVPTLWAQSMRWMSRQTSGAGMELRLRVDEGVLHVSAEADPAADGGAVALTDATAVITRPSGDTQSLSMAATGPTAYEARIPVTTPGEYLVAVSAGSGGSGTERRLLRGLYWSADEERVPESPDASALAAIARAGGGRVLSDGESPFEGPRPIVTADISPLVLMAALALFVWAIGGRAPVGGRLQMWEWGPRGTARPRAAA